MGRPHRELQQNVTLKGQYLTQDLDGIGAGPYDSPTPEGHRFRSTRHLKFTDLWGERPESTKASLHQRRPLCLHPEFDPFSVFRWNLFRTPKAHEQPEHRRPRMTDHGGPMSVLHPDSGLREYSYRTTPASVRTTHPNLGSTWLRNSTRIGDRLRRQHGGFRTTDNTRPFCTKSPKGPAKAGPLFRCKTFPPGTNPGVCLRTLPCLDSRQT